MAFATGIRTQRSAALLLNNVIFEPDPNNSDPQTQQPLEGGIPIEALDHSTIYLKNSIVFNMDTDAWISLSGNSHLSYIGNVNFVASNINDSLFSPFRLTSNSSLYLQGDDFVTINNNTFFQTADLFSGVTVDTSSSIYVTTDIKAFVLQSDAGLKGSMNNVFYGAPGGGEPYVEINSTGTLPTAQGTDSIVIGINNSDNSNSDMLLIGKNIDGYGGGQISIGRDNDPGGDGNGGNVQLGRSIISGAADNQVIIGINNNGGYYSEAVVIGKDNYNDASNTVIVGTSNSTLYSDDSVSIGKQIIISNGDTTVAPEAIAIGSSISIGTEFDSNSSIAIGQRIIIDGVDNICIGNSAEVTLDATSAIQLGTGINTSSNTLQYLANTIATSDGIKLPYQTTGVAPTTSPVDGTLVLDNNGGTTTLWARANGAWVSLISV